MPKYPWTVAPGGAEDAIASGRMSAEVSARLSGMANWSASARRDAALAEILAGTPGMVTTAPVALVSGVAPAIDVSLGTYFTLAILTNIAVVIAVPTNAPSGGLAQLITITIKNSSGGALATAPTFNTGAGGFKFSAVTNPGNGLQVTYTFQWDVAQSLWIEVGTHLAAGL